VAGGAWVVDSFCRAGEDDSTMFKFLLAKSLGKWDPSYQSKEEYAQARGAAKLAGHVAAVLSAAEVFSDRLGQTICKQLGLSDSNRLGAVVKLGAYLHDWGKANQHFQEMVYLKSSILDTESKAKLDKAWKAHNGQQLIRHEFLSGILALQVKEFREWLGKAFSEEELILATWAAIGHHFKAGVDSQGRESHRITELPDGAGLGIYIYTEHTDFESVLRLGSQRLGLPAEIPRVASKNWEKECLEDCLKALESQFRDFAKSLSPEQKVLVAAAKATVIAADLAGSILPTEGEDLQDWISGALSLVLREEDLEQLIAQKLGESSLRPFQEQMAAATHRVTLVKAGCGTGKTLGAYAWAKKWASGRRLFFGYPTTGTATQGYLDYAEGSPIEKALMHSRADLDRELLLTGEGEEDEGASFRLAALQVWRKKLVICTVDSILGLIQNNRRPLFSWPALVQSAFVFDEVHAYDSQMFGALLKFLQAFRGAPILLMSASFTPGRLEAIKRVMSELGEPIGDPIEGPQELEELKRYQIREIQPKEDPINSESIWSEVTKAVQENQKVLWVTNSVASCINIYREAQKKLKDIEAKVLIYHSRFRYKDRLRKHEQIINAFGQPGPVLAVTTQVCEMSLDLSADLLISAMAPATSLIQRLGRLNRRMKSEQEGSRVALFYEWNEHLPYGAAELETGRQLLEQLRELEYISQRDLADIISQLSREEPARLKSAWLDQNWCTYPSSLREAGYTITVLLAEDQDAIWKAAEVRQKKALDKGQKLSRMQAFLQEAQAWSIPIRIPDKKTEWWNWQRRGFYFITEPGYITYSEEVGTP
jgi:CRISPR-associated endonuclease/helicase Cas3